MKIAQSTIHRDSVGRAVLSLLFLITLSLAALAKPAPAQQHTAKLAIADIFISKGQQFACSVDYPQRECIRQLQSIRDRLAFYHAEELGPWTWILVSSNQWKPLLQNLGLNTASPAITSFADRQTLLEESLFAPKNGRGPELLLEFRIPLDRLPTRALTHELGHASCGDRDERRAERAAEQIRRGIHPPCSSLQASAANNIAGKPAK